MSYLRMSWPLTYVEGESEDYIFEDVDGFIEDYGHISDKGFIELLFKEWKTDNTLLKEHLIKRLAKRLDVKLRDKPLNSDEVLDIHYKDMKKFEEENKDWLACFGFKKEEKNESKN